MICTHSGIAVAQENKLFIVGDAADDGCEVLLELVFCIRANIVMSLNEFKTQFYNVQFCPKVSQLVFIRNLVHYTDAEY